MYKPIAVLIEEGGDIAAFESFTLEDAGGEKEPPKQPPKEEASQSSEPPESGSKTSPSTLDRSKSNTDEASEPKEPESSGGRLQTSLDRYSSSSSRTKTSTHDQAPKKEAKEISPSTFEDIPASSMRKTIANRLQQSVNQNPHYFVTATLSVSKLLKVRQALNISADGKYKLSLNDFLIKAVAVACIKVPAVNSSWREKDGEVFIRQHNTVDISVAVATPVGLMTPIVKGVEGLGLQKISAQVKDLGKRARDGKLKPEEYQGGTFTISNMGMNAAVERFTAVINPPQAGILAVGTTRKVAIPSTSEDSSSIEWDDQIVVTGSFDHKVVDGAVGGEWIRELKKVVENPLDLLL